MKNWAKKLVAAGLAAAMMLSMAIGASAASEDYRIHVTAEKQVQFIRDNQIVAKYVASQADLTLKKDAQGNLVASLLTASKSTKNISLGKQQTLAISGELRNLLVDKSVPDTLDIVFSGGAELVTVAAGASLVLPKGADVDELRATNADAMVTVQKGATVGEAYAVNLKSVTGLRSVTSIVGSGTTTTTGSTSKPDMTNKQGQIETVFQMEYRDKDTENCKEITFDGEFEVTLLAKAGLSLGAAMRDLKFTVTRADNNNTVGGMWKWVTGSTTVLQNGTYYYKFTPSLAQYAPITVKVNYTSAGSSRSLDKLGLSFESGQSGHGSAGVVAVTVSIPSQVEDDDVLIVYVGNNEVYNSLLSESDAGDGYYVGVDVSGDVGDKCKIKAKIKRSVGSGSATSRTITYEITR